jgi:antitoxin component of MazEF toxin-antitoxin module
MDDTTNPRKVTTSGGMTVVSLPANLLRQAGIEKGDRVVLTPTDNGFEAEKVTYRRVNDE